MKKIQLIEIGILTVALVCGYKFLESLITIIITTMYQFTYGSYGYAWPAFIQYIIVVAIYMAGFFFLIRYRRLIAGYIDKQGQMAAPNTDPETINISIRQTNLLFIVLVALCLITLIEEIPVLLNSIYNYFKAETGGIRFGSKEDVNFKIAAIRFTLTLIILFYAKPVSAWFSKEPLPGKPLIETPAES